MKLYPQFILEAESGNSGGGGGTLLSSAATSQTTASTTTATATQTQHTTDDANNPPAYDFRSSLDETGKFRADWTNSLPENLRAYAGTFSKYPTPQALLDGFGNAQKLIGQRQGALKAPGPDAKAEDVAKYQSQLREALSIPEKVEDYKIPLPEKLPEGIKVDEAKLGEFSKLAHSLNIPAAAAQKLVEYQMQQQAAMIQGGQAKVEAFVKEQGEALKKEWGDKMDVNLSKALAAAELLGLDPADPEVGNSAKMIKALHAASNLMKSDTLIGAKTSTGGAGGAAEAAEIMNNKSHPMHAAYWGKEGASRQQEVNEYVWRLQGWKKV